MNKVCFELILGNYGQHSRSLDMCLEIHGAWPNSLLFEFKVFKVLVALFYEVHATRTS